MASGSGGAASLLIGNWREPLRLTLETSTLKKLHSLMMYNSADSIKAIVETSGPGVSEMSCASFARRCRMRELPTGTITLLFTDIEGSTRLFQQVGEHYASVLAESRQMLRTAFQHRSGHEVGTQGDAFFQAGRC